MSTINVFLGYGDKYKFKELFKAKYKPISFKRFHNSAVVRRKIQSILEVMDKDRENTRVESQLKVLIAHNGEAVSMTLEMDNSSREESISKAMVAIQEKYYKMRRSI